MSVSSPVTLLSQSAVLQLQSLSMSLQLTPHLLSISISPSSSTPVFCSFSFLLLIFSLSLNLHLPTLHLPTLPPSLPSSFLTFPPGAQQHLLTLLLSPLFSLYDSHCLLCFLFLTVSSVLTFIPPTLPPSDFFFFLCVLKWLLHTHTHMQMRMCTDPHTHTFFSCFSLSMRCSFLMLSSLPATLAALLPKLRYVG